MKIQSRKETVRGIRPYRSHRVTETVTDRVSAIRGVSVYSPTKACPRDAVPKYWLAFGMDGSRFLLELDYEELTALRDDIDGFLRDGNLRRIK